MKLFAKRRWPLGHTLTLFYRFMQTSGRSFGANIMTLPHTLTVLLIMAMVLLLSSCQMPRIAGSDQTQSQQSDTCEQAYELATHDWSALEDASIPRSHRYVSALGAPSVWTQVAVECPGRFAEGSLRSAQSQYRLDSIAGLLGLGKAGMPRSDFQELTEAKDDQGMVEAMILAEDRAGFAMGVLAARGGTHHELDMSDEHKTAAQQLLVHSGLKEDPRQKVYAVSELIANPETITDSATGLKLPTTSVVEIGCVREELAAVDEESDTDDTGTTDNPNDEQANRQVSNRAVLSQLVSSRAYTAFTYGYPNIDAALLRQS